MLSFTLSQAPPYKSYKPLQTSRFQARLYLGWTIVPEPINAGVDERIAKLVARSLMDFKVLFLGGPVASSANWQSVSDRTLVAHTSGRISNLCISSDTELVETLFDQTGFDWSQRGQFAVLFPINVAEADLSPKRIAQAIEEEHIDTIPGTEGYLRPGDDGDFAELGFCDDGRLAKWRDQFAKSGDVKIFLPDTAK
jgi:hypothetical protein